MKTLVHWEIPSTDPPRSAQFYADLFGWRIQTSFGDYIMFASSDDEGGGFNKVDTMPAPCIEVYVGVDDIPATLTKVEELGGTVIQTKTEIGGDYGHMAFFADPCGCRIGLWSKK